MKRSEMWERMAGFSNVSQGYPGLHNLRHGENMSDGACLADGLAMVNEPCNSCGIIAHLITGAVTVALFLLPFIVTVALLLWWARHRDYHNRFPGELNYKKTLKEIPSRGVYCRDEWCAGRKAWYLK